MSLSEKELLEDNNKHLDDFYDKIEDIRSDINNVEATNVGSLMAVIDFVDDKLEDIAKTVGRIEDNNDKVIELKET